MFEALIEQARNIIQRLHASAEQGLDKIPEATRVRPSELEAWDAAAHAIVALLFGANSAAWARWRALAERRGALVGEARRRDIKRGDYFGLIDYFHLAIGALLEFEVSYQHKRASPAPAQASPSTPLALQPAQPEQAPLSQPNGQQRPEPPPVVRATDDGWELTLALTDDAYDWLRSVVATRDPARAGDSAAIVELAATIIERVARNTQRGVRGR
ncbi:MAG TPA: hypothetical protein VKE41_00530 [Roseiflexaceae bacterium]|nr:hypothetical protein [Roseiflexaceae bacterium]